MNGSVPFVYFPTLHRDFLPAELPEGVLTCFPGLPIPPDVPQSQLFQADFAWSPAEAAACLEDLKRLEPEAVRAALPLEADVRGRQQQDEMDALDAFAGRGGGRGGDLAIRRRAQRLLLTAWLQEERVREMRDLAARYARSASALALALHDEEDCRTPDPAPVVDEAALLPSWRFVLEQIAVFLPAGAIVCSADPVVRAQVQASGLCTCGPSAEDAERLPAAWRGTVPLRAERAPLWRLLGRSGPAAGRPWLDAEHLLVLAELV